MRHTVRLTTAALLLVGAAAAASASAATPGTQTLFARQEGCGATAEAGRLDTSKGTADGADGCGTLGGLPLNELLGGAPETYSTTEKYKPVVVRAGAVKGQVAADSWTGSVGGVGTVEVDVAMTGLTADEETVDLGTVTVRAPASPTTATVKIPFQLSVPDEADGVTVTAWSLSVSLRGQNVNANAQALEGDVFVTLPVLR